MAERRRAKRERVCLAAYVRGAASNLNIPCQVVDLSSGGARIRIQHASRGRRFSVADLPDHVVLTLILDQVEVAGGVRWNSTDELGVQFASGFRRVKSIRRKETN